MMRVAIVAVLALTAVSLEAWSQTDDRAATIAAAAREALGGIRLDAVTAISGEGPFRRVMGQRQIEGRIELLIVPPSRMRRVEDMHFGVPGGPALERTSTLSGDEAWDEMNNRGGDAGGRVFVMRGGPGGPDGMGGSRVGRDGQPMDEAAVAHARARRMQAELRRWMLALLVQTSQPIRFAGTAEAPDGTADVLEVIDDRDRPVRLFLDRETHLPLMLTYEDIRPRMIMAGVGGPGGPGGRSARRGAPEEGAGTAGGHPDPDGLQRQLTDGPPPPVTVSMHFGDYRQRDGVMLPHRITQRIGSEPSEEWTIEQYRINPEVKADAFEQKK